MGPHIPRLLTSSASPYLFLLALTIIFGQFFFYSFEERILFKGQSVGILFVLFMTLLTFTVWLLFRPTSRMQRGPAVVLIATALLWLIVTLRIVSQNGAFNYTAFATPVIVLMLILKPPNFRESIRFGDTVALLFSLSIVTTQVLDLAGWRDSREDIVTRWSTSIFGITGPFRWEGMFSDPNLAGFIGAFLFIYGLSRRPNWLRVSMPVMGTLVIVASESRSAYVAASAGLITIFILRSNNWKNLPRWSAIAIGLASLFALFVFIITIDPTLNGRVPIWRASFLLVPEEPLIGIGSDGFRTAAQESLIPWGNVDAHSIVFDPLVRNGIVAGAVALLILAASAVLTFRARTTDFGLSLSVFVTFLAGGLTYTVTSWQYPTVQILPLLTSLLIAASSESVSKSRGKHAREGNSTNR